MITLRLDSTVPLAPGGVDLRVRANGSGWSAPIPAAFRPVIVGPPEISQINGQSVSGGPALNIFLAPTGLTNLTILGQNFVAGATTVSLDGGTTALQPGTTPGVDAVSVISATQVRRTVALLLIHSTDAH